MFTLVFGREGQKEEGKDTRLAFVLCTYVHVCKKYHTLPSYVRGVLGKLTCLPAHKPLCGAGHLTKHGAAVGTTAPMAARALWIIYTATNGRLLEIKEITFTSVVK